MNITEAKKILESKRDFLRERFHVMDVGIFGSFIRGEGTSLSDIDILITFERGHKDFFNYMRTKYYLGELIGMEVDLVIKEAVKPRLREKIFREVEYVR
jgi:predicted nucleotidyltransferase